MPPTEPTTTAHAVAHLRSDLLTDQPMEPMEPMEPTEPPETTPTVPDLPTTLKVEAATHPMPQLAPTKLASALMLLTEPALMPPPDLSATAQIRAMLPAET